MKSSALKLVFIGSAISLLSSSIANAQVCHANGLKIQLQNYYDKKNQNVPYGRVQVKSVEFIALLSSKQKMNVFAGADDRDITNNFNSAVEVYRIYTHTFTDGIFSSILVDPKTCSLLSIQSIFSHYRN